MLSWICLLCSYFLSSSAAQLHSILLSLNLMPFLTSLHLSFLLSQFLQNENCSVVIFPTFIHAFFCSKLFGVIFRLSLRSWFLISVWIPAFLILFFDLGIPGRSRVQTALCVLHRVPSGTFLVSARLQQKGSRKPKWHCRRFPVQVRACQLNDLRRHLEYIRVFLAAQPSWQCSVAHHTWVLL